MLSFFYSGPDKTAGKELTLDATVENLDTVISFVDEELEKMECSMKTQMQIDVAVEEIFVNIAHYAYTPDTGKATIRLETSEDPKSIAVTFIDSGVPYDPLAKPDPDVTLSAEERQIGGLGIYMVKKSMDDMKYEYKDGHNVLTIRKNIN
ncbi:MAG: ATP-binding protein [Firmicutes bacterium]|nr:ATP-binding protein [Bacillota bacterium]